MSSSPTDDVSDSSPQPPAGTFYRIDSRRVTLREYFSETKNPVILLLAVILRLFRVSLSSASDDPNVESLAPFEVPLDSLPEATRSRFVAQIDELAPLGFGNPVVHAIDDVYQNCKTYLATLTHSSGEALARIHNRVWAIRQPPKDLFFQEFLSEFSDATYLWSLSSKPDMLAPASCTILRSIGSPAAQLWAMHQSELAGIKGRKTIVPARNEAQARTQEERHHAAVRDFHVARGVFAPLSTAQEKHAAVIVENRRAGVEHPEILAELSKLQQRKTGWLSGLLILMVSLLLFVGAGSKQWSWEYVLLLVPVLVFHELGHYVAMKVFRYRNVRMFFIPLMGAAVSGVNYSAPGWKKVVVSLMGPVPGVIVGGALGITSLILSNALMMKFAVLALILNALNLLPVLPLDGGRVVHAMFFSRHYVLDVAFRAVAGLVLLGASALLGDRILMTLGILMLIGIPSAWKVARIATELRREGLRSADPNEMTIPPDVAQPIIARLKTAFPKGVTNRVLAQRTANVYETLNTRPPGWLATCFYSFVHGGTLLLAIGLGVFFIFVQQTGGTGELRSFLSQAARGPKNKLDVAEIQTARGAPATGPATRPTIIIATFPKPPAAKTAFEQMRGDIPVGGAVQLFGQSVLVSLHEPKSSLRAHFFDRLEALTKDVFAANVEFGVPLNLHCIAPNAEAAEEIIAELDEYLRAPRGAHLITPWTPRDTRSALQIAQHRLARKTYLKLQSLPTAAYKDSRLTELNKKLTTAIRRGDTVEAQQVNEEHAALLKQLQAEQKARLMETNDGSVEMKMVRRYFELVDERDKKLKTKKLALTDDPDELDFSDNPYREFIERTAAEFGPMMGEIEMIGGKPAPGQDRFSVQYGGATQTGLLISQYLTFENVIEGAPEMVKWLAARHCIGFTYQFVGHGGVDDVLAN